MSFDSGSDFGSQQYSDEMGEAARLNAETGKRAQAWSEKFFADYVAPLLEANTDLAYKNEDRMDQLFNLQFDQAKLQDQRFRQFGIPAEDRFFQMADEFSAPEFAEREAALALGDVKTAQTNQSQQLARAMAARGIDPSSPAAVSAMTDSAVMGSLAEASAVNRARKAARDLGMAVTADAANFGRGGLAGGLSFGQAAGNSVAQGQGVVQGALGAASGAASVPMAGQQTAIGAFSSNMNAWGNMARSAMSAEAQADSANSSGMGDFFGTVIGAGIKYSDRRLKRNIVKVGTLPNGLGVYEFDYVWGEHQRGVLADEVERIMPEAVSERLGFKVVDYGMIGGI